MSRFTTSAVSFAVALLLLAGGAGAAAQVAAVRVSHCPGTRDAEVVQAVDRSYVYEAWIGCGGIGFARSTNGGKTFGPSQAVLGSSGLTGEYSWDPAIAVAPDGTVYIAYMVGPGNWKSSTPMTPVVAVSHDHGQSFANSSTLPVPASANPNFGDRPFVAVGPDGAVYVTWDYGPRRDQESIVCPPTSSCWFAGGDFNAVFQKSTDGGNTWTSLVPISSGYPLGGVFSAPIVAEPGGALDVLYWRHPTDPNTLDLSPGRQYFSRSTDGGTTWSHPVAVGPGAGTIGLQVWWIDGSLAVDSAGTLYAAWDTQSSGHDTAWLSWSRNHGASWSTPRRVASSGTEHLTEVTAAGAGSVYVGWQTVVSGQGYATYLRRYTIGKGWTSLAKKISPTYGQMTVWPGDTFGLSASKGSALLSWGSAVKPSTVSDIYFARATS